MNILLAVLVKKTQKRGIVFDRIGGVSRDQYKYLGYDQDGHLFAVWDDSLHVHHIIDIGALMTESSVTNWLKRGDR